MCMTMLIWGTCPKLRKHYKSNGYFVPGSKQSVKVTVISSLALLSSANIIKVIVIVSPTRLSSANNTFKMFAELKSAGDKTTITFIMFAEPGTK